MSSYSQEVLGISAFASVEGANPPTYTRQSGFVIASVVRNAAGDYSHTLAIPVQTVTAGLVRMTIQGATPGISAVERVSDTVLRTRTTIHDNTATDLSFWIEVLELAPA